MLDESDGVNKQVRDFLHGQFLCSHVPVYSYLNCAEGQLQSCVSSNDSTPVRNQICLLKHCAYERFCPSALYY